MIKIVAMRLPALFLLFAAAAGAQDTGAISGTVRSAATGEPLADAQVSLAGEGGSSTQTDARGGFRFTGLPAARYSLRADKPGFRSPETVAVEPGAEPVTVELDPLAQIEGRVLDEDGRPVAGVTVRADAPYAPYVDVEHPTQADGRFTVRDLGPGAYFLRLLIPSGRRADGYPATEYYPGVAEREQASSLTLSPGQQISGLTVKLRRVPMTTLRGRVVDLAKDDAARPREVALDCEPGPIGGRFARTALDDEGRFRFEQVPLGRHKLQVYRGTGSDDLPYTAIVEAGKEELTVNVPPFSSVTGVVKSPVTPWEGVLGISIAAEGAWRHNVVPDEEGRFTLPDIPPGEWPLRVESNGLEAGGRTLRVWSAKFGESNALREPLAVSEGANPPVVITLSDQSGGIAGTTGEGDEAKQAGMVFAVPLDGRPFEPGMSVHTAPDGSFSLAGLLPGDYQVSAWSASFLRKAGYGVDCGDRAVTVTVAGGQTAAVKLKRCGP